jgi:parvulin-like peptidyl-prolyl isomerase
MQVFLFALVVLSCSACVLVDAFFGNLFGPKRTASASHILIKGPSAVDDLTKIKAELQKSPDLAKAFASKAAAVSTCPSAKNGGFLGKFEQGKMVGPFDKVVFETGKPGEVEGPVKTVFGAHLILISEREEAK